MIAWQDPGKHTGICFLDMVFGCILMLAELSLSTSIFVPLERNSRNETGRISFPGDPPVLLNQLRTYIRN
jgi:hypothetical protein